MSKRSDPVDQAWASLGSEPISLALLQGFPILLSVAVIPAAQASDVVLMDDPKKPFTVIAKGGDHHLHTAVDLSRTNWSKTAERYGLDPYVLYAVALIESAKISDGKAYPWPWALNEGGKASYPTTSAGAIKRINEQMESGRKNIDVGLMQVNLRWHGNRVPSIDHLIDPATNIDIGAQILAESMASVPNDTALGIGRYHAWSDRLEAYRYGQRVLNLAGRLKIDDRKQ